MEANGNLCKAYWYSRTYRLLDFNLHANPNTPHIHYRQHGSRVAARASCASSYTVLVDIAGHLYRNRSSHLRHSVPPQPLDRFPWQNGDSSSAPSQTPIPTLDRFFLPTQCQQQQQYRGQLPITFVTSTTRRDTIVAAQRWHAREKECPRRIQDPQDDACRSIPIPQHSTRKRRTNKTSLRKHQLLSRARAILRTSQSRRPRFTRFFPCPSFLGTACFPNR